MMLCLARFFQYAILPLLHYHLPGICIILFGAFIYRIYSFRRRPRIDAAPGAENINRRHPRIDAACTVRRLFEEKSISDKTLNLPVDGSEDDGIHCLKEGQPSSSGRQMLKSQLGILTEPDTNPFEITDSDVEDASLPEQLLDSDHEEDSDIEID